ncbi:AAA family ATPase [Cardinium endosymbiont of Philonthus spinipes]|uniref:AAA family ATPase n=1 Tax=Cardinium endosymbiont of Philonthus spinipes TaxID=3077941 RepID=UPI00313AD95B
MEDKGLNAARRVRIPIGKASAKQMIDAGFYADKTDYISKLFEDEGTYYFFIRPRRFGKSLLLDTIDQIAQGNKELFKVCAIGQQENYAWKKYPVIWLNFSELTSKKASLLEEELQYKLLEISNTYGLHGLKAPSLSTKLGELIHALGGLQKGYEPIPIVLIDEYDSPLISSKKEQYEDVLAVLSSFFKVLKSRQKDCKFIFVTGVTKFHLSGLTSGANSANDISLHEDYAGMLGYTEEDIDNLFLSKNAIINPVLERLNSKKTQEEKYTLIQIKQEVKDYYNGYCFTTDKMVSVYNPDSILRFFYAKDFENFWFNSGSPTILLQQMKQNMHRFNMDWDKCSFSIDKVRFKLVHPSLHEMPLLPLMYQTGYLTMDLDPSHVQDKNNLLYHLRFPNQEVKSALKLILADFVAQAQQEAGKACSISILESLRKEAWVSFLNMIRSDCLAKAGYRFLDRTEKSFQATLYVFLNGAFHATQETHASAERDSGMGRLDIVMEDQYNGQSTVYIVELKVDKPALDALKQIHSKDYSLQYGTYRKKVLIGLTCDATKLNITEAVIQVHQKDDENDFKVMSSKNFTINSDGYFETT